MRIPNPIATTTTEAYLAYKAGVLAQADLKEKLYHPYIHIDGWLAYWTGLTDTYPTDKNGDPECLTDEEAYIAYLAGVTSEYPEALKDPADPRIAGYLKYLISARFGRPNYPVTRQELYLSMMKPPVVPSGDPSSSIDLEGTVEAPFISMEMYGDTYQKSYSGKNLFDIEQYANAVLRRDGGAGVSLEKINSRTLRATNRIEQVNNFCGIPIPNYTELLGQTVTVSGSITRHNVPGTRIVFAWLVNGITVTVFGQDLALAQDGTFSLTQSIPESAPSGATKLLVTIYANGQGTLGEVGSYVDWSDIQLEVGSSAASYEPYVGGIPSPNPDYPQAVQTVTGRQMVAVTGDGESAEYEINLGKNLYNNTNYEVWSYSSGLPVAKREENDRIIINSSSNSGVNFKQLTASYFYVFTPIPTQLKPNTEYTISFDRTDNPVGHASRSYVYTYDNGTYANVEGSPKSGTDGRVYITFTTGPTGQVAFAWGKDNNSANINAVVDISNIQLEEGSTATDYAPYFEPIELCKIGDYQDYIYRDGEDWYLHKETAKKVFSADEVWGENPTPSGKRFRNTLEGCVVATSVLEVVPLFCSAFVQGSAMNTYRGVQCISSDVIANRAWVYAEDAKDYSTTEFAEYMAGVSVYYPMATPTDTEITNTALLDQLDALVEGGSYEGETHIRVSATDPNLPALLKVEAAK